MSKLVVIDVDFSDGGEESWSRVSEQLALPHTRRVKTGKGFHYYFALPADAEVRSRTKVYPGIDVRADGGYAVAPPSRHVSGKLYEWDNDIAVAEAPQTLLDWCNTRSGRSATLQVVASVEIAATVPPAERPAASASNKLVEGTRNDTLTAVAGRAVRRRLPPSAVPDVLEEINARWCDPPLSRAEVRRIGKGFLAQHHGDEIHDLDALWLRRLIDRMPWSGRTGGTDRAVLVAHVDMAQRHQHAFHHGSVREIAEQAGLSSTGCTIRNAHDRLRSAGWLKLHDQRPVTERWIGVPARVLRDCVSARARCWSITVPYADLPLSVREFIGDSLLFSDTLQCLEECVRSATPVNHDVCGWGHGCGKHFGRIIDAIRREGGCSARAIAKRLGIAPSSVTRTVKVAAEVGIVTRDDRKRCWFLGTSPEQLDRLADARGVAGTGFRRQQRHREERKAFRSALEGKSRNPDLRQFHCGHWLHRVDGIDLCVRCGASPVDPPTITESVAHEVCQ